MAARRPLALWRQPSYWPRARPRLHGSDLVKQRQTRTMDHFSGSRAGAVAHVLGQVLASFESSDLILTTALSGLTVIVPILQTRTLRFRGAK